MLTVKLWPTGVSAKKTDEGTLILQTQRGQSCVLREEVDGREKVGEGNSKRRKEKVRLKS